MNVKSILNARYAELCKELGHLQSNADILAEKIARIKSQIRALNDFSSTLPKVSDLTKEQSKDDSGQLK